jgi:hypothetical protein
MRSGVLNAPFSEFADTMSASILSGHRVRRNRMASTPPLLQPFVVIAGAPHAGKSSLINALIDEPDGAPVDTVASTSAWLVFRHGSPISARAFVPGHREPRPIGLDGLRVGDTAAAGRGGQSRPPRRIEITHPADLLARVALVDTPGVGDLDAATAEVVLDAVERAGGLVFVVDAAAPLRRAQLDLLAKVGVTQRVVFVVTKTDQHDDWSQVLASNRALVAERAPHLAQADWLPLDVRRGEGIAGLRELLAGWADPLPVPPDADPAALGGAPSAPGAPGAPRSAGPAASTAVTVSTSDDRWEQLLDREIRNRRVAAAQRVSIDLATIHVRCVQELGTGQGCPELPYVLDRELHALSVVASRQLELDTAEIIERVFGQLLDHPPTAAVLARITSAARRTVDSLYGDDYVRDRVLLLTTTSAVATLTGTAAADSLSALGRPEPAERVLPVIGVGLNASCYQMWQPKPMAEPAHRGVEKKDCRRWLQQALRVIEVEVARELGHRYSDLQQALAIIGADAVDHGVLLA